MRNLLCVVIAVTLITACNSHKGSETDRKTDTLGAVTPVRIDKETDTIIRNLAESGDYVNSREFPSLIKASVVHENLGNNLLVIDLRSPRLYAEGHIKGSVNKEFGRLPEYFETGIKPFEYDKIVLVCDDGQLSSYTASLLRLMGYGNVFAMRWGMSSWNKDLASKRWLQGLSSKHENQLEKKTNERAPATTMPVLNTGLTSGSDMLASRFKKLFAENPDSIFVSADQVFNHPASYYIINYERKDKYDDAHIPGAVRYKPNATLGFASEMASIPVNKTVVVYCGTGHNSGFATAYLRLLGYDARTLQYGNNGFMHDWMVKDAASLSWLPFSEKDINNFELVK